MEQPKSLDMNHINRHEMRSRFIQLNKLIEAAEAEKASEEFVIKLKAERTEIKFEIISYLRISPGVFDKEYKADFH
tara:strand:+ start:454 stop:681 length:228 start_codon:yes stop_codon:yes gene_type:complete